jgi:UDP-N-acetylmuramoyl-L-alanyl-D-glutamate--2,6-diaminopimelate ligase
MRFPPPPAWHSRLRTIGVTGTNGKTTTTTWLAAALNAVAPPVARPTTVGHYLGDETFEVPRTYDGFIRLMDECLRRGGKYAAIELTSESLALGFAKAWPCEVGVFTNLTHDHLDAHGTPEHYLASKAQLFRSLPVGGTAVLNGCDESSDLLAEVTPPGVRVQRYGVLSRGEPSVPLDLCARKVVLDWTGTTAVCDGPAAFEPVEIRVRAIGDVFAENALAAVLGAVAMGVPLGIAIDAIGRAAPPEGRFEVVATKPYVVVDYAHTPDALERTVAAARRLTPEGATLTVIFGAGGNRDKNKRAPMGTAARAADKVVLTSDNPRSESPADIAKAIARGLVGHPGVSVELDRALAIQGALRGAKREDVIVICGKGHETTQTIGAESKHFSDQEVIRGVIGESGRRAQSR